MSSKNRDNAGAPHRPSRPQGRATKEKTCYIIAGPNGAGKTTFAGEFLPREAECLNFINVDLIAQGLSPFAPEKAAITAAKLLLQRIDEAVSKGECFSFETTLSGKSYARKIRDWRLSGYKIILYYLKLPNVDLAIDRVKLRVSQGGHNVSEREIRRRFDRSWKNFIEVYRPLCDSWIIFDNSGERPVILERKGIRDD